MLVHALATLMFLCKYTVVQECFSDVQVFNPELPRTVKEQNELPSFLFAKPVVAAVPSGGLGFRFDRIFCNFFEHSSTLMLFG